MDEQDSATEQQDFFQGNIEQGLSRMRVRLLDLTSRNRLLNFKHTRRSSLQIVGAVAARLFESLTDDVECHFRPVPKPPGGARSISAVDYAAQLGLPTSAELPRAPRPPDVGQQPRGLQTLHYPDELETILRRIAGAARLSLEETGVNMLHLVFGFLEWYESDDTQESLLAPLVLLPVELRRGDPDPDTRTLRYFIRTADDDAIGNLSLQERLRRDFNVDLPEFNDETPLETYFDAVAPLLRAFPRWRLRRQVTLTLVSFQKLRMFRDLDPASWPEAAGPASHPRVREFFEGVPRKAIEFATDYELDAPVMADRVPPLIHDADSSQHSALVDALSGRNLVIEGPPGTGKSQTITNLIAAALSAGKTVLFVAEKAAALDVVRRRLNNAGLGHFCLELHSHKARKRDVLDDINRRIEAGREFAEVPGIADKIRLLREDQARLNAYATAVGCPAGRSGLLVHDVLWRRGRLAAALGQHLARVPRAPLPNAESLTATDLVEHKRLLRELARYAQLVRETVGEGGVHPWEFVTRADIEHAEQEELRRLLASVVTTGREAIGVAGSAEWLKIAPDTLTPSVLAHACEVLDRIPDVETAALPELLERIQSEEQPATLRRFVERVVKCRGDLESLTPAVRSTEMIYGARVAAVRPLAEQLRERLKSDSTLAEVREIVGSLHRAADEIMTAVDLARPILRLLDCELPITMTTYSALEHALEHVRRAPYVSLRLRHAGVRVGVSEVLAEADCEARRLRDLRHRLSGEVELALAPAAEDARRYAAALSAPAWLGWLRSDYRAGRRAYRAMRRDNSRFGAATARTAFLRLLEYSSGLSAFEANAQYRDTAGPYFSGLDTPFNDLWTATTWLESLTEDLAEFGETGERLVNAIWKASVEALKSAGSMTWLLSTDVVQALNRIEESLARPHPAPAAAKLDDVATATETASQEVAAAVQAIGAAGFVDTVRVETLPGLCALMADIEATRAPIDADTAAHAILGTAYLGLDTDCAAISATLALIEQIETAELPSTVRASLLSRRYAWNRAALVDFRERLRLTTEQLVNQAGAVEQLSGSAEPWGTVASVPVVDLIRTAETALGRPECLHDRLLYIRGREAAIAQQLGGLVPIAESPEAGALDLDTLYDYAYIDSLTDRLYGEHPVLRNFDGWSHERVRERFAQTDRELIGLQRRQMAHQTSLRPIEPGRGVGPVSTWTEYALILHEVHKQKRHIPLRQLIARAPKTSQALKPCFLMSPLSVAQYLMPGVMSFDIVVMDEASQLKPEDALGAILRASQMVVVGDRMQLPPTTFFERFDGEDVDEAVEEASVATDAESILDVASMLYSPTRMLRWHYRSQHGGLIAFSNKEFYERRLIVFPSRNPRHDYLGVHLVKVPGCYENRVNSVEARAVVEAAVRHMREHAGESLGIATMNLSQRDVLEEEFEQRLKADIYAAAYVAKYQKSPEPFFIKNLENVQGDERDVIFVSTTYGPSPEGHVYQRFGPINSPNGHRRLNVLFTRAKRRIVVFSSMTSEDIVVGPASPRGARALKAYLAYAETGVLEQPSVSGREPDSDFEVEVASALRSAGYDVVAQLGVAGYFIDLAVRHPDKPDSYILAVECDGATYHSSLSARDRDRLREAVLRDYGWTIHRIWSADWFRNREREVKRLVERLEQVVREERSKSPTGPAGATARPTGSRESGTVAEAVGGRSIAEAAARTGASSEEAAQAKPSATEEPKTCCRYHREGGLSILKCGDDNGPRAKRTSW